MAARYKSGQSIQEIATHWGASRRGVWGALTNSGVKIVRRNKYACNHAYFDRIDTEAKAYWLGFLFADGFVLRHPHARLGLTLASKDKDHIERFLKAMRSTHRIADGTRHVDGQDYAQASILISSPRLVDALIEKGMTPRKTETLKWPTCVPEQLMRHFARGVFDGDGTWFVHPTQRSQVAFKLVNANRSFLEDFKAFVQEHCEVGNPTIYHDPKRNNRKGASCSLGFRGARQCARLYSFLYDGARIWLPRKHAVIAKRFHA